MAKETKCILWSTSADHIQANFDGYDIFSPRAGGRYQISRSAALEYQNVYKDNLHLRTSLSVLISESQNSDQPIKLTIDHVRSIAQRAPMKPLEKADRLMRYLAKRSPALNIVGLRWGRDVGSEELDMGLAASGLMSSGELSSVLEYLGRRGFCEVKIDDAKGEGWVWLTLEGAQYVAEASSPRSESDRAFVAMWFSSETQEVYDLGISPAIRSQGYQPIRIDQKEHNNKIDDEIISEIRKSRFIVSDFTCEKLSSRGREVTIPRGGVYFEAGFAMGLGIPVIWTIRADLINDVHFDTRQYNHIMWTTPEDLYKNLSNRIGALIGKVQQVR